MTSMTGTRNLSNNLSPDPGIVFILEQELAQSLYPRGFCGLQRYIAKNKNSTFSLAEDNPLKNT